MALGYSKHGSGPHRVMAVHGWFGDHTAYDPMRNALSGNEFTYIFPALRGYGLSKGQGGNYSMKEISSDLLALADQLGWQTFSLIGHSMGGMIIQRVLADAPARVTKLVAVTPVPASGVPFPPDVEKGFVAAANDLEVRKGLLDFSTGNRLSKTWLAHMAQYSWDNSTNEAFAAYFQSWSKTNFVGEIQGNKVPIKVTVGAHDPSLTADVMKHTYMAWYPNAELEVMENTGHYPPDETPVALATSIEAFLRK